MEQPARGAHLTEGSQVESFTNACSAAIAGVMEQLLTISTGPADTGSAGTDSVDLTNDRGDRTGAELNHLFFLPTKPAFGPY